MSQPDRDELIQSVLDGTASHEDAERLKQLAAGDSDLAERKASYLHVFESLNHMPVAEAPPDLRERVLAGIEAGAPRPGPARAPSARGVPRLAFVAAGTVIAALLGYAAWLGTPRNRVPAGAPVVGTLAPVTPSDTPADEQGPWTLGGMEFEGELVLSGDQWQALIYARGAGNVRITLTVEPTDTQVLAVVPGAGGRRLPDDTPGSVSLEMVSPGRAEVSLRNPGTAPPRVAVTLVTSSGSVHGRLESRSSAPTR